MNTLARYIRAPLLLSFISFNAGAADVVSFFPTGSVKKIQQVTARFSADMVAMGDPRSKSDPFTMTCNVSSRKEGEEPKEARVPKHTTRWADSRNWSLDFDEPLKAGIRCAFKLNANFKDVAGAKTTGLEEYAFATAGPAVLGTYPTYSWIEPDQYFVLQLDGPVDPTSVEAKAYFEVEGMPDKVPVNVIRGRSRELVIKHAVKSLWSWNAFEALLDAKPFARLRELDAFTVVAAGRRFPERAKVILHWPKGILSKTGLPSEEPQSYSFQVIEPFQAKFSCERSTADSACNPLLDMRIAFTKSLPTRALAGAKLVADGAGGKSWTPLELAKKEPTTDSLTFRGPFPDQTKFKLILPPGLRDDSGRLLSNQDKYPLEVATEESTPIVKFPATFGILELEAETALPVSVRNVEKILGGRRVSIEGRALNLSSQTAVAEVLQWYRSVERKDWSYERRTESLLGDKGDKFELPKPLGERELELVGIPLNKPGFHVIELASPRLGEKLVGGGPMYVATSALVTDLAVHLKKGRTSSVVWVTRLSTSKPVAGASVSLVTGGGRELAKGTTNDAGLLRLPEVKYPCARGGGDEEEGDAGNAESSCEVYAFARKGEDLSFVSSSWSRGIESYRFNLATEYLSGTWGPAIMHTVLDRMVAQPGEAIQMKHVVREQAETGFAFARKKTLPRRVLVVHQGSNKTYTLPFVYDQSTGTAVGRFEIPKDAALGRYAIYLSNREKMPAQENGEGDAFDWNARETGHFVVSEYRLPLMKASLKIQGQPLVAPTSVSVDLSAAYLSGGPAKGLKAKLRASIQPGDFTPDVPGGSEYSYFARPVKTGVVANEPRQEPDENFLSVQDLTMGEDGGLLAVVKDLPAVRRIRELALELEYTDPNGEVKTAAARATLFPGEQIIGLRSDSWYADPGATKVMGVIVSQEGKPLADRAYAIEAFKTNYITHRKRLVGGFYSYDSKSEVVAIGKVCEGVSDALGRFNCAPKNLPPGSITLQARTTDAKNRATFAAVNVSVYEPGSDSWWVPGDSDRIDLLPERTRYEPGEKAKLVVRAPFAVSTVLMTVEREGVLDAFVTEVRRDNPVVEIPLKGSYAPNVFVSALALRGRVGDPKPTALVDLGKPAMKMGMTELRVGWKAHELAVEIKTDKKKYRTREKAQVTVQVKTASGARLPDGAEVAIAAVDESLLRLKGNTSWEILKAMMGQRGLAVTTSSAQNQVIGRRHFGAKAKPPGGGGGSMGADARELFDPILFWQPRVRLDSSGTAKVSVPLNDSITSFRIVAVAIGGADLFGDGATTIEATKDLILYSGMAPLAREGDKIMNVLTLRNTTTTAMRVEVKVTSAEVPRLPAPAPVELKPSEARVLEIPVTIPDGVKGLTFRIEARDTVGGATDAMIANVRVEPAVPASILQATLFQLDGTHEIPVRQSVDALPGKGSLAVTARGSLMAGLAGVRSYMSDYPYSCLEQKTSKAIALEDAAEVKRVIDILPGYLDGSGMLKFFPGSLCGSEQLTRYVLDILAENGHSIPPSTLKPMLDGLTRRVQGDRGCDSWWADYLPGHLRAEENLLLMETLARYQAFQPSLLETIKVTPNLWQTETLVAWHRILTLGKNIPKREDQLKQATNILRARVNFQGTLMNLQKELSPEGRWGLFTSPDQEALGLFGVAIDDAAWSEDAGRMARGLAARHRRGHWDTTMANAWGVTMFRKFAAKFETAKVSGTTKATAAENALAFDWSAQPNGETKSMTWPKAAATANVPVKFAHEGEGKPWMLLELSSAIPLKAPLELGYKVTRRLTPVVQSTPGSWRVGDVANVELTIVAKAEQSWVVVRDAIPAGASHLGTGLSGSSELLDRAPKKNAAGNETQDFPTEYEEKSLAHFTAYAAYLPRGTYRLSYRVRLNSSGEFRLPPTRVEAMYAPETFAETPAPIWKVAP